MTVSAAAPGSPASPATQTGYAFGTFKGVIGGGGASYMISRTVDLHRLFAGR